MFADPIKKCSNTSFRIKTLLKNNPLGFWISSAMAGAYVGLGVILIFTLGNLVDPSMRYLVMGATFGVALTLVIIAGSELFTGHTLYFSLGVKTGQITLSDAAKVLPATWAGNFLGAIFVAVLFMSTGGGKLLPDATSLLHQTALAKSTAPAAALFAKGLLCNWLVCLAIWMCLRETGTARFIAIWWCLLAFIASGYEHSIANMTIFALSWFGEPAQGFTLSGAAHNLLWVSLGNLVSGSVFVGLGYWYATPKEQRPLISTDNQPNLEVANTNA